MKHRRSTVQKLMKCRRCGSTQIIHRKKNRNKGIGHYKPLWCITCQKRIKHIETQQL